MFVFSSAISAQETSELFIEEEVMEEILLDGLSYEHLNISVRGKIIEPDNLIFTAKNLPPNPSYNSLLTAVSPLYKEEKFSYGQERKFLGVNFGVKYDNKVARGDFEQLRTLYTEYQKDRFSINTSYRVNSFALINKDSSYKWEIAPKYRLTDTLALKYVHSGTDEERISDILFSLSPVNDDRFNLDFGVGEKKPVNTAPPSARILFSTGLSF